MRHALRTFLLALPVVLAAVACSNQPDIIEPDNTISADDGNFLRINSVTTSQLSKSVIGSTSFPADEDISIGLFLEGEGYTGFYNNVKYTRPAGGTEWKTDKNIPLNDKEITVYAYYPYDADVTEIEKIKVASSIDGTDFMWATPVSGVNVVNPDINLTFNHALALVEITFNIYGYEQGYTLENIRLFGSSDGFANSGILNARNGALTLIDPATNIQPFSPENQFTLSGDKIVVPCLLVPISTGDDAKNRQQFTVNCEFADKTLSATLVDDNGVIIRQGTKSVISLNIKNGDS